MRRCGPEPVLCWNLDRCGAAGWNRCSAGTGAVLRSELRSVRHWAAALSALLAAAGSAQWAAAGASLRIAADVLRPARSARRCGLRPLLRFGLLQRRAAVGAALRAASDAGLRVGAGAALLTAAVVAQRCGRRSATGCDWRMPCRLRQARRACSLGCGGRGKGGMGGESVRSGLYC